MQVKDGVERPIAYDSAALNKHQKLYGISDKEGAAVVWAVRKWRQYLHGSQTIIITDHSSLKALTGTKELKSMRQTRYAMDMYRNMGWPGPPHENCTGISGRYFLIIFLYVSYPAKMVLLVFVYPLNIFSYMFVSLDCN